MRKTFELLKQADEFGIKSQGDKSDEDEKGAEDHNEVPAQPCFVSCSMQAVFIEKSLNACPIICFAKPIIKTSNCLSATKQLRRHLRIGNFCFKVEFV